MLYEDQDEQRELEERLQYEYSLQECFESAKLKQNFLDTIADSNETGDKDKLARAISDALNGYFSRSF